MFEFKVYYEWKIPIIAGSIDELEMVFDNENVTFIIRDYKTIRNETFQEIDKFKK